MRFRRVPVQIPREVSEKIPAEAPRRVLCGSGGFGGFRRRYLVRFRAFPVRLLGEVPEGYGARGFWCVLRFRRV